MMNRREFLASAAGLATPGVVFPRTASRPNVLLFMTDQESALLPGPVNRPHWQRLSQRGVQFRSAFCNTPQCSAARSSLLTGLEPNRTHVLTNVDAASLGERLSPTITTIGHVFRDAGYQTAYFGKWHLGGDARGLNEYGFSIYEQGGVKVVRDKEVSTAAAAWIARQKAPWLAWVSILNPHHIYQFMSQRAGLAPRPGVRAPATTRDDLSGKPAVQREFLEKDQGRPTQHFTAADWVLYRTFYCRLVEQADACLGTVLNALPNPQDTIIGYVSDHGDALGEHGLPFKGPFMYEPLIRIPMVFSAPGLPAGVRHDFVTSADVAPTLAGLAGLSWPAKISGRDVSHQPSGRDAVFLEYYAKQKWINPIRTIRTGRWKLNWYDSGAQELYDLKADIHEVRNLAGDSRFAGVKAQLQSRLNAWRLPLTHRS